MSGQAKNAKNIALTKVQKLTKEAGKGVVKELGEISKGVLSELFKIVTLQKK